MRHLKDNAKFIIVFLANTGAGSPIACRPGRLNPFNGAEDEKTQELFCSLFYFYGGV